MFCRQCQKSCQDRSSTGNKDSYSYSFSMFVQDSRDGEPLPGRACMVGTYGSKPWTIWRKEEGDEGQEIEIPLEFCRQCGIYFQTDVKSIFILCAFVSLHSHKEKWSYAHLR